MSPQLWVSDITGVMKSAREECKPQKSQTWQIKAHFPPNSGLLSIYQHTTEHTSLWWEPRKDVYGWDGAEHQGLSQTGDNWPGRKVNGRISLFRKHLLMDPAFSCHFSIHCGFAPGPEGGMRVGAGLWRLFFTSSDIKPEVPVCWNQIKWGKLTDCL